MEDEMKFVQRFMKRFTPIVAEKQKIVSWHTNEDIRRVKQQCNVGEKITLIADGLIFQHDGDEKNAYTIFGIIDRNHLVDYWPVHSSQELRLCNSYWSLPEEYRNYVEKLKSVTRIPNVVVLCLLDGKVVNILRSDDDLIHPPTPGESELISTTDIKNFMLDDPFLDYLQLRRDDVKRACDDNNGSSDDSETEEVQRPPLPKRRRKAWTVISDIAEEFESRTVGDLILRCPNDFHLGHNNIITTEKLIAKGVPIIFKAKMANEKKRIFSQVDLLVRHDYITKLFPMVRRKGIPRFHRRTKYGHVPYLVILFMFKKLALKVDGLHVCKFSNYAYTEGLLAMANETLATIQKSKCGSGGYLLSREGVFGRVDPAPDIVKKATDALEWRRRIMGTESFSLLPRPSCTNLYPNMKNDTIVDKLKTKYAEMIGELTQISFVTPKHRNAMIEKYGVDSMYHPDATKVIPQEVGISGTVAQEHVLRFIAAQHLSLDRKNITFRRVPSFGEDVIIDAYIDFETFYNFKTEQTQPYMFGIWKNNKEYGGDYKSAILGDLTDESIKKFWSEVVDLLKPPMKTVASWGHVEKCLLRGSPVSDSLSNIKVIDLCAICSSAGMILPRMRSYRLKDIGKCLHTLGMTDLKWSSSIESGMDAMSHAVRHYLYGRKWNSESLMKYNETDCRMVFVIHELLSK